MDFSAQPPLTFWPLPQNRWDLLLFGLPYLKHARRLCFSLTRDWNGSDVDIAYETAQPNRSFDRVLGHQAARRLIQFGQLPGRLGTTAGIDTLSVSLSAALSTSLALNSLDISSTGSTTTAITNIDSAINSISSLRGSLGAAQNRLGSTISNLAITSENLSSAESRIRDVDVAYETAQLTRRLRSPCKS